MSKVLVAAAAALTVVPLAGAAPGTLVIDDPAGDVLPGHERVDLLRVWFASDGSFLNVTIEVVDLDEDQQRSKYDVNVLRPDGIAEHRDELSCTVGETFGVADPPSGCTLSRFTGHEHVGFVHVIESEVFEVPMSIDVETDRIRAQIGYDQLNVSSGETLTDIEADTLICVRRTCSRPSLGGDDTAGDVAEAFRDLTLS